MIFKILVVDDDKIVLESCKRILNSEGKYQVYLASNADEAIKLLKSKHNFDLMIMDVKMPEKDGTYLLNQISKNWPLEKWPMLPVLVISGYPTKETMKELKKMGAKKFISKPFTPDELLGAVNEILSKNQK